jgi:hypothetical protein
MFASPGLARQASRKLSLRVISLTAKDRGLYA